MSDLEDREWVVWSEAWRRAEAARPALPVAWSPEGERSGARRWMVALHVGLGALVAYGFLASAGVVLTVFVLFLLGGLALGGRELSRPRIMPAPNGYDSLAAHLERALLAVEAARGRARAVAGSMGALVLGCGPGTWAAWATLDGDSAVPHLPPVTPSLLVGLVALLYAGWMTAHANRLAHRAKELSRARATLLEEGDA
ncbi:MAG: hypothetical protein AMXMBFR53_35550 [Gemmatimonadota bacterium]